VSGLAISGAAKTADPLELPRWPIVGDDKRQLLHKVRESRQWEPLGGARADELRGTAEAMR